MWYYPWIPELKPPGPVIVLFLSHISSLVLPPACVAGPVIVPRPICWPLWHGLDPSLPLRRPLNNLTVDKEFSCGTKRLGALAYFSNSNAKITRKQNKKNPIITNTIVIPNSQCSSNMLGQLEYPMFYLRWSTTLVSFRKEQNQDGSCPLLAFKTRHCLLIILFCQDGLNKMMEQKHVTWGYHGSESRQLEVWQQFSLKTK